MIDSSRHEEAPETLPPKNAFPRRVESTSGILGGAITVGVVSASFAVLSDYSFHLFKQSVTDRPWLPFLLTPLGLVAVVWATRRFFPGSEGSGIPQVIVVMEDSQRSSLLSLRVAIGKVLLTVLALGSGASIGREGPSVHIGAAIMNSLSRFARFPSRYMRRGLIMAGGAAGIAAAFNTPLAGIVFAIEELNKSFEQRSSGLVLTAVVFAGIAALVILGQYHYFGSFNTRIEEHTAWAAILLCGILGGLFGGLFAQMLISGSRAIKPLLTRHPYYLALGAGLIVAIVGTLSGQSTFGTGYEAARDIITEHAEFDPWFPLSKMIATLASYFSGVPGGIFAPSLSTGAGVGVGVGANLAHWIPVAPAGVMIMLGMVGYFSGVVQSPLTSFVIVMEMTNNQEMLLALIATAYIGSATSHLVCPKPLYSALAESFLPASNETSGTKPVGSDSK